MDERTVTIPIALARRCLFVIGPAKSGTTVLMEALNDAPAIYLLNEPDLHRDAGEPGFAARFNAHYARWASQPTKGHFCPDFLDGAGSWGDSLARLAESHALVGTKIVTRPFSSSDQIGTILRFHTTHFYESHYLFSFRAPEAVVTSSHHFQRIFDTEISPVEHVIRNFLETVGMAVTMKRIFPNVRFLFHEEMGAGTFAALERALEVGLPRAASYYEAHRVVGHEPLDLPDDHRALVAEAADLYAELRALAAEDFPQLQLAQNYFEPDPATATRLGRLAQRCDQLARQLAAKGAG